MQDLTLSNVTKRFGPITAVADVELRLDGGKMVSFLGPSGCGKTTLLRLVAGLEVPSEGRISLGERDITEVPAHKRNIGMVFQSLALFPHLNVRDNIVYGLKIRGQDNATMRRRADELLEMIQLPDMGDRHVTQLSGGQRQRVAIARALALDPDLFLLDEPLSALDANLREAMQIELRQLQQRIGVTTIVVTHDQSEAMTMSDLVVVMSDARVQQAGPPLEIYRNPINTFVADFIGTSNLMPARVEAAGQAQVQGRSFAVDRARDGLKTGDDATLLARPEDIQVLPGQVEGGNRLPGRVDFIRDIGATVEIIVACDGHKVIAMMTPKDCPSVATGDEVTVVMPAEHCVLLRD